MTSIVAYSGSARQFSWYGDYRSCEFHCRCGWFGPYGDLATEAHRDLLDASCPQCDTMLAIVSYPLEEETREAAREGNREAQRALPNVDQRNAFLKRYAARELQSPDQLPDLKGNKLRFVWDFEGDTASQEVVIRRLPSGPEVWREVEAWDNWEHFIEVRKILRARYGARFKSLTPSTRAELWLFGDDLPARGRVAEDLEKGERKKGDAMELSAGRKAARTRMRRAAGRKAAVTRKRRAAGKKAARTRKRRAAAKKAAATRSRKAAVASTE